MQNEMHKQNRTGLDTAAVTHQTSTNAEAGAPLNEAETPPSGSPLRIPAMFELYLAFGLRNGTLAKLRVQDVDLANSRLHITLNKQRRNTKVPPVLDLLMPPELVKVLADFIHRLALPPHAPSTCESKKRGLR